jgi:hypothetical protein
MALKPSAEGMTRKTRISKIAKSEEEQFLISCPNCRKDFFAYFVSAWVETNPKGTLMIHPNAPKPWVEYRRVEPS